MKNKTLGEIAFNAYGDDADWKTFDGRPIPQWMELGQSFAGLEVRKHWEAAALAAIEASSRNKR